MARSLAVLGRARQLVAVCGGRLLIAHGVMGLDPGEPSELDGIRRALQREADEAHQGSGRASKALGAVQGLDELMSLGPPELEVLAPSPSELEVATRLQSSHPADRAWRSSLGMRARRLDSGEAVSIAIAMTRGLDFATDDEAALVVYRSLATGTARRTREMLKLMVSVSLLDEDEARADYELLHGDDLHRLGGPAWDAPHDPPARS